MLKKELVEELEGFNLINERMMQKMNSPLLQQQLNKLSRKSKEIILVDFNKKVDTNETDTYPENCGKYGLGLMNDEGERLLKFCTLNHLAVMNTMYKQSRNKVTTWMG